MSLRSHLLLATAALALTACGGQEALPPSAGFGADPQLPQPRSSLFPTVNVAPAIGWPAGRTPVAAQGLKVQAFAAGLDHPRWLYRLPNGDILVAETNAPPKPEETSEGIRGFFQGLVMKKAGAAVPSPNRITLLRDTDGDGVAETRTVFLQNLMSPFGMVLVGDRLYVANADAVVAFPYQTGQTSITEPGTKITDLPAGRNHHWTKNIVATRTGRACMSASAPTPMSARTAWTKRPTAPPSWRSIRRPASVGSMHPACAIRSAWTGTPRAGCCGLPSMSVTRSATIWSLTT